MDLTTYDNGIIPMFSIANSYVWLVSSLYMDNIFVARVMSTTLPTVSPETHLEDAAQTMLTNNVGAVLVVDEDTNLKGILTTTDFVRIVTKSYPDAETEVSAHMITDVITVSAQDTIQNAADLMLEHNIHHLPVVDEMEGIIGIVTTTDVSDYISSIQLTPLSQTGGLEI